MNAPQHDDQVDEPMVILLTVEEAARRLGIGRTLMYSLLSTGEIESVTIGRLRTRRLSQTTAGN